MPYLMMSASNGDLIVFGSTNQTNARPWAIRVSPAGDVVWEFVEGDPGGWLDNVSKGQRFYGGLELSDQTTLLCGYKNVNRERLALLVHLSVDGQIIEERLIKPASDSGILTRLQCVAWSDGVALIGGVSGSPAATGWLAKLDSRLNVQWQKFDEKYLSQGVMAADGGNFFFLNLTMKNPNGSQSSIMKMGSDGRIAEQHAFPSDDTPDFIVPLTPRADLNMSVSLDNGNLKVIHLDSQLRGPTKSLRLENFAVKKALELSDHSFALFGSQIHNVATAAVARMYPDGTTKVFLLDPPYQSPWFQNAVFTGNGNEIAAVRRVEDGRVELDWVAFQH